MDLDQNRHGELVREPLQLAHLVFGQARCDQQDAIGTHRARFPYLVGLDDEILAQHGKRARAFRCHQVRRGALEESLVCQHREAGGACRFITTGDRRGIELLAQYTARGTRFLYLRDHRGIARAQRSREIARRAGSLCPALELRKRRAQLGGRDLRALHFQDALEDRHFFTCFVKAMNSSILCFAAPLLIAWLARSTPAFRLFVSPAT